MFKVALYLDGANLKVFNNNKKSVLSTCTPNLSFSSSKANAPEMVCLSLQY